MASKDGIRPGRHLCHGCYNYYLNKPTTVRRPGGSKSMKALLSINNIITCVATGSEHPSSLGSNLAAATRERESEVRKQIAEAQRGG